MKRSSEGSKEEPVIDHKFLALKEFKSAGRGFWANVPDEQWNDWKWQLKNRITNVDQLQRYLPTLTPEEHAGTVLAATPQEAMTVAMKTLRNDKLVYNIWAISAADIRFTSQEDRDLWNTLPDKKFRDAGDYKGGEKLKAFLERSK